MLTQKTKMAECRTQHISLQASLGTVERSGGHTSPSSCGIYNTRRVWHPSGVFGVLGLEIEVARDVPGTELEIVLRHGRLHPAAECAEGLGHLPELVDGNAIDLAPVLKDATAKDANTKLKKSKVRRHKS